MLQGLPIAQIQFQYHYVAKSACNWELANANWCLEKPLQKSEIVWTWRSYLFCIFFFFTPLSFLFPPEETFPTTCWLHIILHTAKIKRAWLEVGGSWVPQRPLPETPRFPNERSYPTSQLGKLPWDKTCKGKMKTNICNTSQSLLKTVVLIHNNSCYNKRAFKNFKSELIYSSDCIKS